MDQHGDAGLRRRDVLRRFALGSALAAGAVMGAVFGVALGGRPAQADTQTIDTAEAGTQDKKAGRGKMTHVVLVGDSTLDNEAYVARGQAVIDQMSRVLPRDWQASLLAVDGATTDGVARQLARMSETATHIVLSVGGNDALSNSGVLREPANGTAGVIGRLADIQEEFAQQYTQMLRTVLDRGLPLVLCTIYYPNYPEPNMQRLASTAEAVFNDTILRAAFAQGLPVIDLRLIFDEKADYANAIEPSAAGGAKIARAVVRALQEHDFDKGRSEVFV